MGVNKQKSKYEQYSQSITKLATSVVMRVSNGTTTSGTAVSSTRVWVGPNATVICYPGSITVRASSKIKARAIAESSTQIKGELVNEILNKLKSELDISQEAKNEYFGIGVNNNEADAKVYTAFMTEVKNAVEQSIDNSFNQTNLAVGQLDFPIEGVIISNKCTFDAQAVVDQVARNVSESVMEVLVNNDIVNEMDMRTKLRQMATNAGLDFGAIFLIIIVIIIAALLITGKSAQSKWFVVLVIGVLVIWLVFM